MTTAPVTYTTTDQAATGARTPLVPNSTPTAGAHKSPPPRRAMSTGAPKKPKVTLAKKRADPNLRYKLPDSQLTPALLAKRKAIQHANAPAAPGSSYTNSTLAHAVASALADKYGAQDQQYAQTGRQLDTRQNVEIPAWFQAYRDQLAGAQAQQAQATQQQVGSIGGLAQQAAGDVGGTFANPEDAARAAAAAQIRSAGVANQGALAQNLGSIQGQFLGNMGQVSYGQQQAAGQHVADQRVDLNGLLSQLAQEKGDFKTTERQSLLSDEADNALKAALTGSQITQNTASASAATTNAKTSQQRVKLSATKLKTDAAAKSQVVNKWGYTAADWAALTPAQRQSEMKKVTLSTRATPTKKTVKPVAGPGSLSSSAETKTVSQINKVVQALQNPTITVVDPITGAKIQKKATAAQTLAQLKGQNIDPRVLAVADSIRHNNGTGIGAYGIKMAHDLGIHVSPHWKIVK